MKIALSIVGAAVISAAIAFGVMQWIAPGHSITGDARIDAILHAKAFNGRKLAADFKPPEYILVNFWASWCPPCLEETPSLIRFAKAHKNFLFVSVSQDSGEKELVAFMKAFPALGQASDLLVLDRGYAASFQVEALPESVIFSVRNKKVYPIHGAIDWDQPDILTQIEGALTR